MSDSTKTIAQRVAAAHIRKTVQAAIGQTQARPTKTAASDRNFFAVVDKQGWRKIRQALQKDGDTASVKLWDEATRDIAKAMELPSRTDMALTKMLNLIDQGPRDPGMTRNAVFKIADLLGIKMPHGIFASTPMLHSARKPLDLRRPPQPPFKAGDASIHAGELLNPRYRATAIKGALFHLGKYKEHAEDAKSEMGQHHATAAAKNKWLALAWTQVAEEDGQRVPSALSSFARKHSGRPLTSAELLKQAKHKAGLPPYGSWRKFVDIVQLREAQDTTHLANEDLKHALSELRGGFAQFSLEDNRDLKAIQAAVIDAQGILHEKAKLQDKFNKQMNVVYGALKKAGKV